MSGTLSTDLSALSSKQLVSVVNTLLEQYGEEAARLVERKVKTLKRCWILSLPHGLISTLLTSWIPLKDVVRLDSAFCNQKLRKEYTDLLQHECIYPTPTERECNHPKFLWWMLERRVQLRAITLRGMDRSLSAYVGSLGQALQCVDLTACGVTDSFVSELVSACPNLRSVCLARCDALTHSALELLGMRSLQSLDLSYSVAHTQAVGVSLQVSCQDLQYLNLDCHTCLSDSDIKHITRNCPSLRTLSLNHCTTLTLPAFADIGNCPHLHVLSLNHCNVTDEALACLAGPDLRHLSLASCPLITDAAFCALLQATQLTYFDASHNTHISSVHSIASHWPHLQTLALNGCSAVTVEGVVSIIKLCAELRELKLYLFSPAYDNAVRHALYTGKYWLGAWEDRKLVIYQTTSI
ncbi:hypothetical protein B484DRAFT_454384 [Ochromonadaceae sp. CCMP2298]|nr:hypothetical protein B484DRAFT_454384 [Ochromonadaceae sp. CCMP2298]